MIYKIKTKILFIFFAVVSMSIGVALVLSAASDNITFYYSPSNIPQNLVDGKDIRIGGIVKDGSISKDLTKISFEVTDYKSAIYVIYEGIVPNLFKEGQGAVVKGKFVDNIFIATELLAKHDERYMPPYAAHND